jgi:hypothetical protein
LKPSMSVSSTQAIRSSATSSAEPTIAGLRLPNPIRPTIRRNVHGSARGVSKSVVLLTGDRGFESISLHRRVWCEPDFLAFGDDPGTGGFLVEAFNHLSKQVRTVADRKLLQENSLSGCEPKSLPYLLCQMNLLLHGLDAPRIDAGNALRFKLSEIGEREIAWMSS